MDMSFSAVPPSFLADRSFVLADADTLAIKNDKDKTASFNLYTTVSFISFFICQCSGRGRSILSRLFVQMNIPPINVTRDSCCVVLRGMSSRISVRISHNWEILRIHGDTSQSTLKDVTGTTEMSSQKRKKKAWPRKEEENVGLDRWWSLERESRPGFHDNFFMMGIWGQKVKPRQRDERETIHHEHDACVCVQHTMTFRIWHFKFSSVLVAGCGDPVPFVETPFGVSERSL